MQEESVNHKLVASPEVQGMFNAAIVFRCMALLHIFLLIATGTEIAVSTKVSLALFVIALLSTAILFLFRATFVEQCLNNSTFFVAFLSFDIILNLFLMTVGGGWRNSWYIYTFNTIFLAAVFKKIDGALFTAAVLNIIYIISLQLNGYTLNTFLEKDILDQVVANVVSYFFAGGLFGYPATLIGKLHNTRLALEKKAADLNEAGMLIEHFRDHSINLKEAMLSVLEPDNLINLVKNYENSDNENTSKKDFLRTSLTAKEKLILDLMIDGLTNQEVANRMGLSTHTVDSHKRNIYQKLGVNSAPQAIALTLSSKLLD